MFLKKLYSRSLSEVEEYVEAWKVCVLLCIT